jgi:hypothetical protein
MTRTDRRSLPPSFLWFFVLLMAGFCHFSIFATGRAWFWTSLYGSSDAADED